MTSPLYDLRTVTELLEPRAVTGCTSLSEEEHEPALPAQASVPLHNLSANLAVRILGRVHVHICLPVDQVRHLGAGHLDAAARG